MGLYIENNKLVIMKNPKTFHFNLPKGLDNNSMHEIVFIVTHNELLAKHTMKNELVDCCPNTSMESILINTKNSKTSEPHKYVLKFSQISDLKKSNKNFALQNVSIHYTWKNIRQLYKNIKLKIIAPT